MLLQATCSNHVELRRFVLRAPHRPLRHGGATTLRQDKTEEQKTTPTRLVLFLTYDLRRSPFHLTTQVRSRSSRPLLITKPTAFPRPAMAGVYPFILLLLLLVAAAQLGLTAFLISCFGVNGWPGQRESGPLIVKALYVDVSHCRLRGSYIQTPTSIYLFLLVSGWTMLGSLLFVAFGNESNPFFTGVACLAWVAVTILLWVRSRLALPSSADEVHPFP
jgi:hypothetical protein